MTDSRTEMIPMVTMTPFNFHSSIFISRGNWRPAALDTNKSVVYQWPTPAMKLYESQVNIKLAYYYYEVLTPRTRERMLDSMCRELYERGKGVFKRVDKFPQLVKKLSINEFKVITKNRMNNLLMKWRRGGCKNKANVASYYYVFSDFTEGETVECVTPNGQHNYEAKYMFDSMLKTDECYVKFASRRELVPWEKRLVSHIDLTASSKRRRVTRQMTARKRRALSEATNQNDDNPNEDSALESNEDVEVIVLSDDANHPDSPEAEATAILVEMAGASSTRASRRQVEESNADNVIASQVEETANTDGAVSERTRRALRRQALEANLDNDPDLLVDSPIARRNDNDNDGEGVARANNSALFDSSSSDDEQFTITNQEENRMVYYPAGIDPGLYADAQLAEILDRPGGLDYDDLLDRFGRRNVERPQLTQEWLVGRRKVPCPVEVENDVCPICVGSPLKKGYTLVYDIRCDGELRHVVCTTCMNKHVASNPDRIKCPMCRFNWLSN